VTARFRFQVKTYGICDGTRWHWVRFLLPILIPATALCSFAIIWVWEHLGKLFPNVAHVTASYCSEDRIHGCRNILLYGWKVLSTERLGIKKEIAYACMPEEKTCASHSRVKQFP
jgi:hypothetical protein